MDVEFDVWLSSEIRLIKDPRVVERRHLLDLSWSVHDGNLVCDSHWPDRRSGGIGQESESLAVPETLLNRISIVLFI